jgi:hypothetical protein
VRKDLDYAHPFAETATHLIGIGREATGLRIPPRQRYDRAGRFDASTSTT